VSSAGRTSVRVVERQWLEERLAAGQSYGGIAREVGRDPSTVSYWARRHGLTSTRVVAHASRGGIAREVLNELVDEGLSVRAIAARLDRSGTTVRHWLRAYGLQTRRKPTAGTLRSKSPGASGAGAVVGTCPRHGETTFIPRRDSGGWRCVCCRVEAVTRGRQRVKETLVAEAGGRCSLCGYDRYVGALGFHHLDPAEKRFGINRLGTSLGRARAEAQKCVLLCANCHAEVEAGVTRLSCGPQSCAPQARDPRSAAGGPG
jgi:transposase-like protein